MNAAIALILALSAAFTTPCEYEDSSNCTWIASDSGNGTGQSFVDIDGTAYYLGE